MVSAHSYGGLCSASTILQQLNKRELTAPSFRLNEGQLLYTEASTQSVTRITSLHKHRVPVKIFKSSVTYILHVLDFGTD